MGNSYQQTDTVDGVSGSYLIHDTAGTPGSASQSISIPAVGNQGLVWITSAGANVTTFPIGNYVVPVNVTTANMNLDFTSLGLYKRSNAGTETLLEQTTVAANLGTTGVKTLTLTTTADYTVVTTDRLMFVVVCTNGAMTLQTSNYVSDQVNLTPIGEQPYSTFALIPRWPFAIREWAAPKIGKILSRPLVVVPAQIH